QAAYEDRWGSFYSAYCPIYDKSNNIVGVIGVDYSAVWYDGQVARNNAFYIILSCFSLLIGGAIVLLITLKIRRRLRRLYRETSSLATDLESLTDEITGMDEQSEAGDEGNSNSGRSTAGETIEALGNKVRSMQDELKKYIFHVRAQAYTDVMTGFGNKTAYLDTVNLINKKIKDGNAFFSVAMFDINGLKSINDNFGHEVGDTIISDAASVIKQVFDQKRVFRIGGDEFLAILENVDQTALKEMIAELDEKVAEFNKTDRAYPQELSFSRGYSSFDPSTDTEFRIVFKRVDEAMYRNKAKYYAQINRRRYRDESGITD
ncbi:MAG: GGDEF domain-containing protein, partial [Clostridia bacterium]|nr:GGDEF domain-containing protein [Clostridia bacterium]